MSMTKAEKLENIHETALREFDRVQTSLRDERLQCLQDRRFYSVAGAQWEGPLGIQFENKPRIEVNKVHLAVIRIFNEYRNNRIGVTFTSKDGTENDELADSATALFRADEQDSNAEEAYDNGYEEGVGGGFAAWRLRSCYEDEEDDDDERQRIKIEPIYDADSSVFFDLDAKRQDKSDAKKCWVVRSMTREAYKEEWNDDPTSWPKQIHQRMFDWLTPDVVFIAEYYVVEQTKETVHIYRGITGDEVKYRYSDLEDEDLVAQLDATGYKEARQKRINVKRVHKYIMSGSRILEDCGYIAGKEIPIVPFYGKRWFVDSVERCMGHVRLAKDSQRLKNMQLSKLAEYAAYSAIEKPIFTPEQVAGHQVMWAEDNLKNYPYLLNNALTDANGNISAIGPQAYTKAPDIPPAMAALLQITEQDMQDVLGNQQAGEIMQANLSGKAVELVQGKLDMQAFIYISNMAKAKKRTAQIWLSMAKEIYVEDGRKMKGVGSQGELSTIELRKPTIGENGEKAYENDLGDADFDLSVDIGPSSSSKKQAIIRALTGVLQMTQDPETANVLISSIMMNMEGEGLVDIKKYFRKKMLRIGAAKPTEEESQEMQQEQQGTPPDPNAQFLQASAEQAQAQAAKSQADAALSVQKAKESEAKTAEILAGIDQSEREQLLAAINMIRDMESQQQQPPDKMAPQGM